MLAYTYEENGKFVLKEKEKPTLQSEDDAIVRVTLASICSSDLAKWNLPNAAMPRTPLVLLSFSRSCFQTHVLKHFAGNVFSVKMGL